MWSLRKHYCFFEQLNKTNPKTIAMMESPLPEPYPQACTDPPGHYPPQHQESVAIAQRGISPASPG